MGIIMWVSRFCTIMQGLLNCCRMLSELQNDCVVLVNIIAGAAATDTVCTAQSNLSGSGAVL